MLQIPVWFAGVQGLCLFLLILILAVPCDSEAEEDLSADQTDDLVDEQELLKEQNRGGRPPRVSANRSRCT